MPEVARQDRQAVGQGTPQRERQLDQAGQRIVGRKGGEDQRLAQRAGVR